MLTREAWLPFARDLDWGFSHVTEREVFPEEISGRTATSSAGWAAWEEPYKTTYREYVHQQHGKEQAVEAVMAAVGRASDFQKLDRGWLNGLKLHAATLPLAEFAAVVGNLRAARFGRSPAWRAAATLGALDEMRHTGIPLRLMHELVPMDPAFDWTHRFFHTNNWVAIAARHLVDELLLGCDPIEFAIGTHLVFETGFTNLQFVGLSSMAHDVGDRMFEKMVTSIQTDEARHAQIGPAVARILAEEDPARLQALVDKWFWRSWHFFAIVTGFSMDYLTPLHARTQSFREFVEEWILEQFDRQLTALGLEHPWYWDRFLESIEHYHHMVYASAYTYRATVWFDLALPSPAERAWLERKYPDSWALYDPIWQRLTDRCRRAGPNVEWYTHGATPVTFCDLCQLVLCGGTPLENTAETVRHDGRKYVFCSAPCRWIFEREPERYAAHKDVVKRILAGEAPANLLELVRQTMGLTQDSWGKDLARNQYPWLDTHSP
jgi:toluene monooxygenase system protein A